MPEVKEKNSDTTVQNNLIPEEVERLREIGVEVEQGDQEEGDGGGGDGTEGEEDPEQDPSEGEGSGDGEEEESQEEDGDETGSGDGDGDQDGEEEESGDGEGSGGDGDQQQEQGDDPAPDNSGIDPDDLEQLEEESDAAGDAEEMIDEDIDEHEEALRQAGGGSGDLKINCYDRPESSAVPNEWVTTADMYATQLGKSLVDHFRQERKTDTKKNQRSGTFDSDRLISADRGSAKVFKSEDKPDEKKYHAVIAIDDSGSMGGRAQKGANIAGAMLVSALEEAGVETTVYRYASDVRLVKTAAQAYEQTKKNIIEKGCHGGTCLLPVLEQVEEISENVADETFFVNLTDGCPRAVGAVQEKLDETDTKSITLQIKDDRDTFRGYYDGFVLVDDVEEIPSKAKSAFRRVML